MWKDFFCACTPVRRWFLHLVNQCCLYLNNQFIERFVIMKWDKSFHPFALLWFLSAVAFLVFIIPFHVFAFWVSQKSDTLTFTENYKKFITVFINGRHFSLSDIIKRSNFFKQCPIVFLSLFRSACFCQQSFAFGHLFKIVIENCPCICRIDTFYSNIDVFVHTVPPIF